MTCDLCKRRCRRLLCNVCAEMIRRLVRVDARMNKREVCESERLKQVAAERARAAALPIPTENK